MVVSLSHFATQVKTPVDSLKVNRPRRQTVMLDPATKLKTEIFETVADVTGVKKENTGEVDAGTGFEALTR